MFGFSVIIHWLQPFSLTLTLHLLLAFLSAVFSKCDKSKWKKNNKLWFKVTAAKTWSFLLMFLITEMHFALQLR